MARHVGLELGTRHVKAVMVAGSARSPKIARWARVHIEQGVPRTDALIVALRQVFGEHGFPKDGVILALDGSQVQTHEVSLPFTDRDQIRKTIKFELEQFIPDAAGEDLVVSWEIVDQDDARSRVLCAVVHKERLEAALDLMADVGVDPVEITFDAAGLFQVGARQGLFGEREESATTRRKAGKKESKSAKADRKAKLRAARKGLDPTEEPEEEPEEEVVEPAEPVRSTLLLDIGAGVTQMVLGQQGMPRAMRALRMGTGSIAAQVARASGLERPVAEQVTTAVLARAEPGRAVVGTAAGGGPVFSVLGAEDRLEALPVDDDDDDDDDAVAPPPPDLDPEVAGLVDEHAELVVEKRDALYDRMCREITRTLGATAGVAPVGRVLVTGGMTALGDAAAEIGARLETDCRTLDPLPDGRIQLDEDAERELRTAGAAALGSALLELDHKPPFPVRLRQEEFAGTRAWDALKGPLTGLLWMWIILMGLVWTGMTRSWSLYGIEHFDITANELLLYSNLDPDAAPADAETPVDLDTEEGREALADWLAIHSGKKGWCGTDGFLDYVQDYVDWYAYQEDVGDTPPAQLALWLDIERTLAELKAAGTVRDWSLVNLVIDGRGIQANVYIEGRSRALAVKQALGALANERPDVRVANNAIGESVDGEWFEIMLDLVVETGP